MLDGGPSSYGYYGMLPNVLASGSQAYDALISLLVPTGDANLDGTVDYADFQALQADYNGVNAYWLQGDFNDDGVVNSQDLNILRQDLNPSGFTLSQFAQQAVFGQPTTLTSPTGLEYDGYGVTYASGLTFASSSGTVNRNQNSQGSAIVLGGATYSEGLGVLANSSVSFALNQQYSRFETTIGVDGSSSSSSVIFTVYGDGNLLYTSPTMNLASGAVPIDLNVSSVTTLKLVVSPASGSNASTDNAVWADARLVSTANFGSTTPYTLTWQLSQDGTVLSTQTTDSFSFAALSGAYTISLTATDANGDTATASTQVTVDPKITSATLSKKDTTTEGKWIGTYGTQGTDIIGDASSLPPYATITPSGELSWVWSSDASAPALADPGRQQHDRSLLVQHHELLGEREPDRWSAAPPLRLRGRLRQQGPERDDPGHRRDYEHRAGYRIHLVVLQGDLPRLGRQRKRRAQGDQCGWPERRDQRALPRSGACTGFVQRREPGDLARRGRRRRKATGSGPTAPRVMLSSTTGPACPRMPR